MASKKFYVVWQGRTPGIYDSWQACSEQVQGAPGARFKSFHTEAEAQRAWQQGPDGRPDDRPDGQPDEPAAVQAPAELPDEVACAEALAVDAACSGNPGPMEYRGVHLPSGREVFHYGPVYGTNNIGEFLAIVHALALLTQQGRRMTVYSDSRNALMWVRARQCRTTLPRNERTESLYQLIERAERWLKTHSYAGIPLRKWDTANWGEVPADFGRK